MTADPIQNGAEVGAEAVKDMRARKDAAYEERNRVVAALAKLFPSGTARTDIPGWDPEWHGAVYIDLPSGQVSWHFHDSQWHLFADLPKYAGEWDGHDTPEKYRRLAALAPPPAGEGGTRNLTTDEERKVVAALQAASAPAYDIEPPPAGEGGLRDALRPFAEAADTFEREYGAWMTPDTGCNIKFSALAAARAALRAASAEVEGAGGLSEACKPWRFGVGDPPDYYSPLMSVYSAGVTYAVQMLASLTDAGEYVSADGSESFEGDVSGTIMNVLKAAKLYDDEDGTWATLTPATAIEAGTGETGGGNRLADQLRPILNDAMAREALAQHLHDEEHGHNWTWPEHDNDDGYRGNGGYVQITPTDVQMECREQAERILIRVGQIVDRTALARGLTPAPVIEARRADHEGGGSREHGAPTGQAPKDIETLAQRIQSIATRWKGVNGGIYTIRAMSLALARELAPALRTVPSGKEREALTQVVSAFEGSKVELTDEQERALEDAAATLDGLAVFKPSRQEGPPVPSRKEREGWQPISECPRDARKIIGWCLFGRNYEEGEARFCSRYIYEDNVRPWEAHGCIQKVTHFKPWPDDAPASPDPSRQEGEM